MNCFQKSYLWLLNTTFLVSCCIVLALWIAFKNLIFDYWTQPSSPSCKSKLGCELLSKILSLTIEHNFCWSAAAVPGVVNCFQKSYLWLLNTTLQPVDAHQGPLWIAFKNLIFDYWTQLTLWNDVVLSVVNCFQKSYLWLLNTTTHSSAEGPFELWIAFKNLIFDYWTQHGHRKSLMARSCELLSKILSLTIEHNTQQQSLTRQAVVNCFQKSYLWLLNTTLDGLYT